jgi:hypothetical protein
MNLQHDPQFVQSNSHKLSPTSLNLAISDWSQDFAWSGPSLFPFCKNRIYNFGYFLPEIFSLHGDGAKESDVFTCLQVLQMKKT